jgi:hypothetical protein
MKRCLALLSCYVNIYCVMTGSVVVLGAQNTTLRYDGLQTTVSVEVSFFFSTYNDLIPIPPPHTMRHLLSSSPNSSLPLLATDLALKY